MTSKHPQELGETYWQHFWTVMRLSFRMWKSSVVLFIHAIFPDWDRFNFHLDSFSRDLQVEVVTRQMKKVHTRLIAEARRAAKEDAEKNSAPTNGTHEP